MASDLLYYYHVYIEIPIPCTYCLFNLYIPPVEHFFHPAFQPARVFSLCVVVFLRGGRMHDGQRSIHLPWPHKAFPDRASPPNSSNVLWCKFTLILITSDPARFSLSGSLLNAMPCKSWHPKQLSEGTSNIGLIPRFTISEHTAWCIKFRPRWNLCVLFTRLHKCVVLTNHRIYASAPSSPRNWSTSDNCEDWRKNAHRSFHLPTPQRHYAVTFTSSWSMFSVSLMATGKSLHPCLAIWTTH